MSLQLVCINYGSFDDAVDVLSHCRAIMPTLFFDKIALLHPKPAGDIFVGMEHIRAVSPTQNECCMYEMPQYITCDHALGVQWDGFIVNPDSWTDEFLEYDYVAPPWPLTNIVNPNHRVGSGGFFLASKKMVQLWPTLCEPHPFPNDWSTGACHRERFEKAGMRYAPLELAMKFGEEIPLDDQPRVEKPFGFHDFRHDVIFRKKYYDMVYKK